jgi:hypothetical protein
MTRAMYCFPLLLHAVDDALAQAIHCGDDVFGKTAIPQCIERYLPVSVFHHIVQYGNGNVIHALRAHRDA